MSFEKPQTGVAGRDCDVRFIHQEVLHSAVRTAANGPRPSVLQEHAIRASSVDNPNARQHIYAERNVPVVPVSHIKAKPVKKFLQPRKVSMRINTDRSVSRSSMKMDSIDRSSIGSTQRTAIDTGHVFNQSSTIQPHSRGIQY